MTIRAMLGTDLGFPAMAPIEHECARGHDWQHAGGCNAGCDHLCRCSVPVNRCAKCGDYDYGDNDEAKHVREACLDGDTSYMM